MTSIDLPDPTLQDVGGRCLARKARQLSRLVTSVYDEALAPHGLKPSQFTILIAVGSYGRATPRRLTEALDLEKSTVSRGAERLARGGWLETLDAREGRGVEYRLTGDGRRRLGEILPDWRRAQEEVERRIGEPGVAALAGLIDEFGGVG